MQTIFLSLFVSFAIRNGIFFLLLMKRSSFFFSVCNFVVHDRCCKTVVSPCSSVAIKFVKVSLDVLKFVDTQF